MTSRNTVLRAGPLVRVTCYLSPFIWGHAYIDPEMGTLLLCTDYGDWTYRWGLSGMPVGVSFLDFIVGAMEEDPGYVTRKLMPLEARREFDAEATQKALRRRLAGAGRREHRRGTLDIYAYREAIGEISVLEDIRDLEQFGFVPEFVELHGYEDAAYRESHLAKVLRTKILPAIAMTYRANTPSTEVPS